MEDDVIKLRQDVEELKKMVLELQQNLRAISEASEVSPEGKKPSTGVAGEEITRAIRSALQEPGRMDLVKKMHRLLGDETLILGFNLRGFCVINDRIWTHEKGFSGIASLSGESTVFFVHADRVRENRNCPGELIERFFSIFSSRQRVSLMRALLGGESKTSTMLKEEAGLTEGQFYHHMRELAAADCVLKKGQDQYQLSDSGKILLIIVEAVTCELAKSTLLKPSDLSLIHI